MDQRTFAGIIVENRILQPIQLINIQPHAAAVRASIHFDHAFMILLDQFGFTFGAVH